ncbi:ComEC/Rec2 family competence protein [Pararhizobium gei]|uniref:ComEC/Rec2 family competence protein n=1 Tax=Pararhizobium gei TaxID=1395951 RepID=UPI0023D9862D|nr:ComEC/Rec2 family competence protein [Rhizobium gei]
MGDGKELVSAARSQHREAWFAMAGDSRQVPETASEPARARRLGLWRKPHAFARLSHIKVVYRRAVEEEQAFGHGFLFVPVCLGAGSLVWFSTRQQLDPTKIAVLLCIFGIAAFIFRHSCSAWRTALFAAALILAGMVLATAETARKATVILDSPVTTLVRGTVLSRETTDRGHWRYTIAIGSTANPRLKRPPETVTLLSRSRGKPIEVGGGVEGKARLSPPSGPALPGLNDFAFDSYFKSIGAVGYFYGAPAPVESGAIAGEGRLQAAQAAMARMRESIGHRIRSTIGGDAGAIAAALITAEEKAIGRETIEALREAGLAHVLAISGLNMVLAAGTFLIGARTLLSLIPGLAHRFPIKKAAAAGALVMVFLYILISGGAVSAVRSWIMISIMLVAVFVDRPSISLRNVALSAIVILVITPSAVTGPGFQMSFAATLALVAGYSRWRERPKSGPAMPTGRAVPLKAVSGFFGGLLLSSLIGGLATMIYSAGYFHRLAAYGLVGNILAMPVISILVMPFALLAMLLMPFGLDRYPLLVMGQGLEWVIFVAKMVSSWGGEVTTGRIPVLAFVLIATGGVLACLLRTWLALSGIAVVAVGLCVAWIGAMERPVVVIAEDGRMVAMIHGRKTATNREKPPDFVFSQWQRALVLGKVVKPLQRRDLLIGETDGKTGAGPGRARNGPPVDLPAARRGMRQLLAETKMNRFACVPKQWCAGTAAPGWKIVTVEDVRFLGAACDEADIVVTPVGVRLSACRSSAQLFTGRSLRRTGAIEIFAAEPSRKAKDEKTPMRLVTALNDLQRPWVRHRSYDWRSGEFSDP